MLPRNLQAEHFAAYPPEARKLAVSNLNTFERLPLSFLPAFLRELIDYDYKFPEERKSMDAELSALAALSPDQTRAWFEPFAALSLSPSLEQIDWVNEPGQFLEQESAWLWTTRQQDAFRQAATGVGDRLRQATPAQPLPVPRLGIAVIGQGVASWDAPLFRNLRPHGTYFGKVRPERGFELLLGVVEARAQAHQLAFGHWYVDGAEPARHSSHLTCVSYGDLAPVRASLLDFMQRQIQKPGAGPEQLRTSLARLLPSDLGLHRPEDQVLNRFQLKLLTEGSGTQIFSTTFVQWTAREALRRAQPLTLLVRFAPRQRQRPMNELLSNSSGTPELDYAGSLIDADMGAYYHWINQQRLPGSEASSFVVWFEGQSQALAIGPALPRGAESDSSVDLAKLLELTTG